MNEGLENHPQIHIYLDRVCARVKAKEVHKDIRQEMLGHLEELILEKVEQDGMEQKEAVAEALRQMGDPDQIGKQLHTAHKPRLEWSVLALVAVMIVIGLVSLYSLKLSLNGDLLVGRKLVFGIVGVVAMIVLYFFDYRRLLRYSWLLYGGTLLLMAATLLLGDQLNGARLWLQVGPFGVNVFAMSPYLLIIAIAGMLQKAVTIHIGQKALLLLVKDIAIYMLIPAYFYIRGPALGSFAIYGISLAILLLVAVKWRLLFTGLGALTLMLIPLCYSPSFHYAWKRYTAFLHPNSDSLGYSFMTLRSVEAIHSGGMWGQGIGIVNRKLPNVSTDLIYSYLVYSHGWVFGSTIAAIVLLFILRNFRMGFKLQNSYAKSLVVGLSTVLGIQFVWNLLMCIGLLPILGGMPLPIISWSSGTMIELGAVGLMLGAYRRKDMVGSYQRSL